LRPSSQEVALHVGPERKVGCIPASVRLRTLR
jgi:hypothetical protein